MLTRSVRKVHDWTFGLCAKSWHNMERGRRSCCRTSVWSCTFLLRNAEKSFALTLRTMVPLEHPHPHPIFFWGRFTSKLGHCFARRPKSTFGRSKSPNWPSCETGSRNAFGDFLGNILVRSDFVQPKPSKTRRLVKPAPKWCCNPSKLEPIYIYPYLLFDDVGVPDSRCPVRCCTPGGY